MFEIRVSGWEESPSAGARFELPTFDVFAAVVVGAEQVEFVDTSVFGDAPLFAVVGLETGGVVAASAGAAHAAGLELGGLVGSSDPSRTDRHQGGPLLGVTSRAHPRSPEAGVVTEVMFG
jgi:hypothetical protein